MNIFEKMSAITAEITAVAKNLNVGWGKNQYKAVGEADVLAAVKPIEEKHKVYSYPLCRQIVESGTLVSTKSDGSETRQQFMRLETIYRFVDMENPSDYIDITTYGDGVDSQDKAPGKAMTYADKYALLKAYKIITGDDPDQEYSKALKEKRTTAKAKTKAETIVELNKVAEAIMTEGIRKEFVCELYKVDDLKSLTSKQMENIVKHLPDIKKKQEEKEKHE